MRDIVKRIAKELYGTEDINELNVKSKLALARKLRYDYASTVKQIARILRLERSALIGYI